jgi:hypothetical protein
MYLLIAVILVGVVTIKKSLDNIEKSTANLEKYANDVYKKAKKLEAIMENIKINIQNELEL